MLQPKPCSNSSSKSSAMGKLWRVALTNAEIADRLDSLAGLLDITGSSPYAPRAYRRAAETIRETPASIPELVRTGRVRDLRGIGPGIEARLRELVETGRLAELDALEGEVSPELVGLGRLLGFGPQQAAEIGRALGVRTVDEFRAAAAEGRLGQVPGIGPKTEAKLLAALARGERPRPRRGLLLNRALALERGHRRGARRRDRGRPAALAGLERGVRGRVLRFEARAGAGAVRAAAADRLDRRAGEAAGDRGHGRGRSGRGRRRGAAALRDRAPAGDRVGRVRRGARAAPGRAGRGERLPRTRYSVLSAGVARGSVSRRAAGARLALGRPRRPARPHGLVGRQGDRAGDGRGGARARLRVPRDLRPHAERAGRAGPGRRRRAEASRGDRCGERAAGAVPDPARDRVRHPARRLARPSRRRAGRARLGAGERACRPAGATGRDHEADGRGDAASGCALPEPSDRADDQPPARERGRPGAGVRGRASRRAWRSR